MDKETLGERLACWKVRRFRPTVFPDKRDSKKQTLDLWIWKFWC